MSFVVDLTIALFDFCYCFMTGNFSYTVGLVGRTSIKIHRYVFTIL